MIDLLLVTTTVATLDDARRIARTLVEQKLAACVQISAIESVYRWDGAVQQQPEQRLLIKTSAARYPALEVALRQLHPYELPAIVSLPADAWAPFVDWVDAATRRDVVA